MTLMPGWAPRTADRTPPPDGHLERFTTAERWVHRTTALLMGVCLITAACLYVPSLATLVGRRALIKNVHVYTGLALPVPLLAGIAFRAFRADARRMNRFTRRDWQWLRSRDRRSGAIPVGKFNAGQKLFAAGTLGTILVMLMTGLIMRFPQPFALVLRTGSTFVHDWLALGYAVAVIGHFVMAWKDPTARFGMRRGHVPLGWAQREHEVWAEEQTKK